MIETKTIDSGNLTLMKEEDSLKVYTGDYNKPIYTVEKEAGERIIKWPSPLTINQFEDDFEQFMDLGELKLVKAGLSQELNSSIFLEDYDLEEKKEHLAEFKGEYLERPNLTKFVYRLEFEQDSISNKEGAGYGWEAGEETLIERCNSIIFYPPKTSKLEMETLEDLYESSVPNGSYSDHSSYLFTNLPQILEEAGLDHS